MNTYDKAYELAAAIRDCDEMKRLIAAGERIKGNEDAKKLVKEYLMAQMQADYAKLAGQQPDEKTYAHLQELAVMVSNNGDAQEYLQAFIRWQQVAADLQKIIGDAMMKGMDVLELEKK